MRTAQIARGRLRELGECPTYFIHPLNLLVHACNRSSGQGALDHTGRRQFKKRSGQASEWIGLLETWSQMICEFVIFESHSRAVRLTSFPYHAFRTTPRSNRGEMES
ncbi:hypothetical protein FIBSPDRAFT_316778 [Athelia psychrophila]|uniref:Uncharacterized protein n=1 Tax=Athelia psychrophila TaxID=1759441 RepID=A0A167WXS5_9AGAM|nr:hypothetical protein FIBSPDRAFT_316778 [Fibularhizoctonia sp. CBS 109695]